MNKKNEQRDALLDIEEIIIKGRQSDRTAQNILRRLGNRTDARALDFRGRAEDVIARMTKAKRGA